MSNSTPTCSTSFQRLIQRWRESLDGSSQINIHQLLEANNAARPSNWIYSHAGLRVDLRRTPLNDPILAAFLDFADTIELADKIKGLLAGASVNTTEQRPAHHSALRAVKTGDALSGHYQQAQNTQQRVCAIANTLRAGEWLGADRQPITDVVNLGIGGSDLGPRMACTALTPINTSIKVHFVANVDPAALDETLAHCSPRTTLFIVASKSFGTKETLANANAARQWLSSALPQADLADHFIAVTANTERAAAFGIREHNILPMWDWVGGRYSLWSAIGLPLAIAIGERGYTDLLAGAHSMDEHFCNTALDKNIPVLLALLELFYTGVYGCASHAVLPYSHRLRLLPDYLQQLCMESNGKSVTHSGEALNYPSCPIVWGAAGTVGQHSFHQLLHQGTHTVPVDFVLPLAAQCDDTGRQHQLVANCLAQAKALTDGKTQQQAYDELIEQGMSSSDAERLAPHKIIAGNQPCTLIGMTELSAKTLGALLALYEHKVYVASACWDINAFDQWGVELGKDLAAPITAHIKASCLMGESTENTPTAALDATTMDWIAHYCEAEKTLSKD